MRKLFSIFAFVLLYLGITFGQAAIDIPITVVNGTNTKILAVGLDLNATVGIDPALGESDLPPFPSAGVFEARFDLTEWTVEVLSTYKDFRNAPSFPFSGETPHKLTWQLASGVTTLAVQYNLPVGATMLVQDGLGENGYPDRGGIYTSPVLSGTGSLTIPAAVRNSGLAYVTMTYTNIAPIVPAPIIGFSPASLHFGTVNVGDTPTLQVTVNNTGDAQLSISNIVSSNDRFTVSPTVVNIPAGGSAPINVTFTPLVNGLQNGVLTFTHNAAGGTSTYTVDGTGYTAAPVIGFSPASLHFGTVNVGDTPTLQVTVNNTGDAQLSISNIVSSNDRFTVSPTVVNIPAGGSAPINVTFTPLVNGLQNGVLTFTHNAAGGTSTYTVDGTGYTPAPVIGFSPASLHFGTVNVGDTPTLQVTVNNTGDAQLSISNIVSSNDRFTVSPTVVNIPAGGSAPINVTFTPLVNGLQNGVLTFTHNAAGGTSTYTVDGTGYTPAPVFSINPVSLNFGLVGVPGSATLPVVVTNTGDAPLNITGILSSNPLFTFSPATATINPGLAATFNVTFTPTAAGVVNGSLTFSHNAAGTTFVLPLQGEGRTQGGLLKFVQQTRTLLDGHFYTDAIVLSGYTGEPLKALQFDLILGKANEKLVLNTVTRGDGIPAPNFTFDYQVYPGPIQPDGSHRDRIKVVILGNTNNVIMPGGPDVEILKFSYDVVDITGISTTTTNGLENVFGATATPVADANILAGPDELLTIYNGTINGLLGDVNLDNQVDLLDILVMIDHILGRITLTGQAWTNGDIAPWIAPAPLPTPDGVINVLDLAVLQNIVLTGLYPSGDPVNKIAGFPFVISDLEKITPGMDAKLTFFLYKSGITVALESVVKVKGVQIELNGVNSFIPINTPISSVFDQKTYYQLNGFLRTLTYDGQSLPMDAGEYLLAKIPFSIANPKDIEISKIIVADENNSALQKVEVEIKYDEVPIPLDYSLSQNFPNPFNPTTSVEFSVPKEGLVTIKLYDMLGQEIAALYSGNTQAGTYTLNWDGKDYSGNVVSSGSYIYRMTAGDFVQSKKMTYLK